ncbi:hypothetical protein Lal_00010377 [Lupinus albus]|nr:hypothetical protein Lal_00010377 [Lupinus albus]
MGWRARRRIAIARLPPGDGLSLSHHGGAERRSRRLASMSSSQGFKCRKQHTICGPQGTLEARAQALSQLSLAHSLTKP